MATIVTTDDSGTLILPAELLGAARPNTPYIVEADGDELFVRPQNGHVLNGYTPDADEWERQRKALAAEIGAVWPADVSAADVISDMRDARGQGLVDN